MEVEMIPIKSIYIGYSDTITDRKIGHELNCDFEIHTILSSDLNAKLYQRIIQRLGEVFIFLECLFSKA